LSGDNALGLGELHGVVCAPDPGYLIRSLLVWLFQPKGTQRDPKRGEVPEVEDEDEDDWGPYSSTAVARPQKCARG
jgi:hypothetical protein